MLKSYGKSEKKPISTSKSFQSIGINNCWIFSNIAFCFIVLFESFLLLFFVSDVTLEHTFIRRHEPLHQSTDCVHQRERGKNLNHILCWIQRSVRCERVIKIEWISSIFIAHVFNGNYWCQSLYCNEHYRKKEKTSGNELSWQCWKKKKIKPTDTNGK